MYGCVLAGATIVLAKTSLTERELHYQAGDADCTHVITDEQYTTKVIAAVANLNMKALFCIGSAAGFVSASQFSTLDEKDFYECPIADPRKSLLAVCYTSGSTGLPKGAEITHYNYVASFHLLRLGMPWGDGDIFLGSIPITHITGMMFSMTAILEGACCALVSDKLTPTEILDTVIKYKATTAFFFPSQLQAIVCLMRRKGHDLPSMRAITVGGSALSSAAAEAARQCFSGLKVLQKAYGMTESCSVFTCQSRTGEPQTTADVGVPLSNCELKVVDVKTRQKLGPHQTGEICYRAPTMVRGYYKRPKETAELFDDEGWCMSGDAGYYDESGRLYIVERLKQMIKCMDKQVVPAELEELLLRQHAEEIVEVSVVGLPHSDHGEAPAAAIVLSEVGSRQDLLTLAERIKATVASNFAVHKHLHGGVYFVDSIPKTETAKVNRPALARTLLRS
ncbi:luciferin 4-monooxygenase-like isoform X1 [Dermacentor albipictus]|uniref:luciferin 4-monooxygenase-like isoform X1 n=1 Tax=Dermacentor albipictus TaxID=60249 RepID=UPI0038FD2E95